MPLVIGQVQMCRVIMCQKTLIINKLSFSYSFVGVFLFCFFGDFSNERTAANAEHVNTSHPAPVGLSALIKTGTADLTLVNIFQSSNGHITQMSLRGRDWQTRLIYQRPGYR